MTEPLDDGTEAAPGGSIGRAALRFALLLALLGASFAAVRWTPLGDFLAAERLQALLADLRGAWWSPIVHLTLFVVFGAIGVPATPFVVAGAAIFGWGWGTFWNWLGIVLASAAGFLLSRLLGREFVERLGGDKVKRAERILHRRGFLPLVAARFVPIPFALLNAAAAVVGVRLSKFVAATAIGMAVPITIITYFSAALLEAATGDRAAIGRQMAYVLAAAAFLIFLPIFIRRRLRRRRLRTLRSTRSRRSG